jgi:hypothetical protein
MAGVALTVLLGFAFLAGRQSTTISGLELPLVSNVGNSTNEVPAARIHPEFLSATASHGGSNMAVCTAYIDEHAEGFFALDFTTGDLKAWVYYPKAGQFGGLFMTNVQAQLGSAKNPEYLLVSGSAASAPTGSNIRAAGSLIYVVDMRSGFFAAYSIPWDRSRENSLSEQWGPIVFMSGGKVREPSAGAKKPVAPPAAAGAGAAKPDPNAPAAPKPDPNANPNNNKNNRQK